MDDSVVSPRLGTQPNTVSSQQHIDETNDGIYDSQSHIVETTIPRADYHTPNLTVALMLSKVYMFMLPFVTLFFAAFRMSFLISLYDEISHFDDDIHTEETQKADINRHLSYLNFTPVIWPAGYYPTCVFPICIIFSALYRSKRIHWYGSGGFLLMLLSMLGLVLWGTFSYDPKPEVSHGLYTGMWRTGVLPTSPSICEPRLEEKQRILFDTEYYSVQFARAMIYNASDRNSSTWPWVYLAFNETRFLQIHNNAEICHQGFEGNQDLYGLGLRLGIYLQWITAFITNNCLPAARQTFQGSWIFFSIAMCILALVASIANYCVFGIEIEILYWLYWGGFVCVCASAPSHTRLAGQKRWVGLDWDIAIHYTMHTFMACHGFWFSWWGYDQVFARLPCGTYHFMFARFLDPSVPYCYARDALSVVLHCLTMPLLLVIPFAIIIMAAELKASIKDSAVYHMVFDCAKVHTLEHGNPRHESVSNKDESERRTASVLVRLRERCLDVSRSTYYMVRRIAGMPEHRLGGIRLITPVDVRHRRHYRISCLIVWLASFSISVTAIETTLAWNRVTSVHSLTSLGQMLSFMLGLAPFIAVLWKLLKQELTRRQDAKRRTIAADDVDLDTLPTLPLTFSGAIQSAFRQSDEEFLTNAAALPRFTANIRYSDVVPDNDAYTMSGGAGPGRQSTDTASELASLTETDWETATEGMSSVSNLPIDRGTAGVNRD